MSRKRDLASTSNKSNEDVELGMEHLWKEVFPVGTEWEHYEKVYEFDWVFSNLEEAFEEGGILFGKKVYLFGCTEPQLVNRQGKKDVLYIPVVVAVTSPFPPSDKLGITSVQMEGEMIVPMKEMKMDWVPYVPDSVLTHSSLERYKCEIYILKCKQRRVALKQLKEERVKRYQYCLPYFNHPLKDDELEVTVISIVYPMEDDSPPLVEEFDCELDEVEEFTSNLVQQGGLPAAESDKFMEFVKSEVRAFKKRRKEARLAKKEALEKMDKSAYENMKMYKFYPVPSDEVEGIQKNTYINRYYGKADMFL